MYLVPSTTRTSEDVCILEAREATYECVIPSFTEHLSRLPVVLATPGAQSKKRFYNRYRLQCKRISCFSHMTHQVYCNLISLIHMVLIKFLWQS